MTDRRIQKIEAWLTDQVGFKDYELTSASEDASFRRYLRVTYQNSSFIVMDAPPDKEDVRPFVEIAGALRAMGVNAPAVHAKDEENGFLLLDDFGNKSFLNELNQQTVDRLYGDALGALVSMQACGHGLHLPEYDRTLLQAEMNLFRDWLVSRQLGIELAEYESRELERVFEILIENALAQPRVFVHRDFHSRNLMVTESHNPGVIDFQDAVYGPVTYDLVSLLRDCYIDWPISQVEDWVMGYYELAVQSGVLLKEHESEFLGWFDLMGVQRQLKASGIFARLNQRDGKPGYMNDIPRTLKYVLDVTPRYSVLSPLADLLVEKVIPGLKSVT